MLSINAFQYPEGDSRVCEMNEDDESNCRPLNSFKRSNGTELVGDRSAPSNLLSNAGPSQYHLLFTGIISALIFRHA